MPTDFSQKRETYYEALRQPTEAGDFIKHIQEEMRKALQSLDGAMPRIRDQVRLLPNRKKKPIVNDPKSEQLLPKRASSCPEE